MSGFLGKIFPRFIKPAQGVLPGITQPETPKPLREANEVAFGAPWVIANFDMLGKEESDPILNARFVPEWKLEGLDYKDLKTSEHAWCSVAANADLRKVGVKGTENAGASSWSKWGKACPYWFGAHLPIEHQGGGKHVNKFLYWINERERIAATLDGNKNNHYAVNITDLAPGGDKVIPSPRWPAANLPDGQFVSKEEVLAKYPFLAVKGSAGGSTT